MCVRALLGLEVVGGSCFSADQIFNIALQLGAPASDLPSMVAHIERAMPLASLAQKLRDAPATVSFPAALVYDLRQSLTPTRERDSSVNVENVLSRIVYWLNDVECIAAGADFNEARALRAAESVTLAGVARHSTVVVSDGQFRVLTRDAQLDTATSLLFEHLRAARSLQLAHTVSEAIEPLDFLTSHVLRLGEVRHFEWLYDAPKPDLSCQFAFPEQAWPVAARDFEKLLEYFYLYATDLTSKEEIRSMVVYLGAIKDPNEYNMVIPQMQARLMDILPDGFAQYVGENVWQRICFQLCSDPLVAYVTKMTEAQRVEFLGTSEPNVYAAVRAVRAREALQPTAISAQFPHASHLVKPLDAENLAEYQRSITRCDAIIEEAFQLVQTEIRDLLTQTETADMVKVHNIRVLNENELKKRHFMQKGLSGWNFPLLKQSGSLEALEPRFRLYSVNKLELAHLLSFDTFLIYLIIRAWIFALTKHTQRDMDLVRESLLAMHDVARAEQTRSVLCALLNILQFAPPNCSTQSARRMFLAARALYETM